jgi:hypothetical protein
VISCERVGSSGPAYGAFGARCVKRAGGTGERPTAASFAAKSAIISRPTFTHFTDTPEKVRSITDNVFRAVRTGVLRPSRSRGPPTRTGCSRAGAIGAEPQAW